MTTAYHNLQTRNNTVPAYASGTRIPGIVLQRKCACGGTPGPAGECEQCRRKREASLQRRAAGPTPDTVSPVVHEVLRSPGQPLDAETRAFMEPRFGKDLTGVRVHADARAAASARTVSALAYTVGRHMVFGEGQYAPKTLTGRGLLAHELTHVGQQGPADSAGSITIGAPDSREEQEAKSNESMDLERNPVAERSSGRVLQRAPKPGTSVYDDSAVTLDAADPKAPGVTSGTVTRREFGDQHKLIHEMDARVRFDAAACKVTVPVRVGYREPTAADFAQFTRSNPTLKATAAPKGVGRQVFDRYIAVTNERLNGWFAVQIDNCKGTPCSGRMLPIQVEATEDNANPDYWVSVVDGGDQGRSTVNEGNQAVVLAGPSGKVSQGTLAHEAGHMALAHGDEYHEDKLRGADPSRERPHDFSLMADHHDYGGWALLHERHFQFVTSFLEAAFKASGTPCRAQLAGLSRPPKFDFHINFSVGYGRLSGSSGPTLGAGVGVGVLSASRNWRGFLEAHGAMIAGLDGQRRMAFLLGGRIGVERRFTPSSGGLTLGAFAESGAGHFELSAPASRSGFGTKSFWAPYGEAGVRLGYGVAPAGGLIFKLFAEAAAGTTLKVNDPDHQYWFRAGLGLGFEL